MDPASCLLTYDCQCRLLQMKRGNQLQWLPLMTVLSVDSGDQASTARATILPRSKARHSGPLGCVHTWCAAALGPYGISKQPQQGPGWTVQLSETTAPQSPKLTLIVPGMSNMRSTERHCTWQL